MRAFTIFLFFFIGIHSFAQENVRQKQLIKEAQFNHQNFYENPKKAFETAVLIVKEAEKINSPIAELTALMTHCKYFRNNSDFENMMIFANLLEQKARLYNQPTYEASAKVYQSEIYYQNSQPEKWNEALNAALKLLEKSPPSDSLTWITKSNVYACFSNYHQDFESRLKYIKKSIGVKDEALGENAIQDELYLRYSNLAVVYYKHKIDSAKYYALWSLAQSNPNLDSEFNNYLVLTKASLIEKNYQQVLAYAEKAEKIKGYKDWYSIQLLYDNIIATYDSLDDEKNILKYKSKSDSLSILISQNRNKYLLRALNENDKQKLSKTSIILISLGGILLIILFYLIFKKRKKKNLNSIETKENVEVYDYSKLIEFLKNKDKSFMIHFDEAYPDFSKKLLELNPKMVQSEIEFCALLKLKIPTKDIAAYTNIEAKTVRNKKYRIRRKLEIPEGVDIYQWFNEF